MADDDMQPSGRPYFFDRLDLSGEPDERAVKRAYARELKRIDVEADPAAFQFLREAYEAALGWLRDGGALRCAEGAAGFDEIDRAARALHLPQAAAPANPSHCGAPPALRTDLAEAPAEPDPEAIAEQVCAEFLARCAVLDEAAGSAPWEGALRDSLADPRMLHVDARNAFEQRIAARLADGWRPGQHCLFPAAVKVFEWRTDRRRVHSLGTPGYILHFAMEQRAVYDLQYPQVREQQRRVIARLREGAEPSARELIDLMPTLATLEAHFPAWLSLITDADNIAHWHALDGKLSSFARLVRRREVRIGIVPFIGLLLVLLSVSLSGTTPDRAAPIAGSVAAQHLERGDEFLERDNEKAVASYTSALAADPDNGAAHAGRAMALTYLSRHAQARADLKRLEALEPASPALFRVQGLLATKEGRHADAVAAYARLLELDAGDKHALIMRGYAYKTLGQPAMAMQDADQALKLDPGWPWAHLLRARLHREGKQLAAAREDAAALLRAAPADSLASFRAAAIIHFENGDHADAVKAMDKVVAANPVAEEYLSRSEMRPMADVAARRADIEQALWLEPDGSRGLVALVRLELRAKHWDGLMDAVDRAAKQPSIRDDVQFLMLYRGIAHAKRAEAEQAAAAFSAARGAATRAADLNNLCFEMAVQDVALPAALAMCEEALVQEPDASYILDSKAFTLMRMKRYRDALVAYDQALAGQAANPDALYGRGIAKLRLGRQAAGQADIKAALVLSPGMEAHYVRLEMVP